MTKKNDDGEGKFVVKRKSNKQKFISLDKEKPKQKQKSAAQEALTHMLFCFSLGIKSADRELFGSFV